MSGLTRERERGGHWHYASHSVRPSLLYRLFFLEEGRCEIGNAYAPAPVPLPVPAEGAGAGTVSRGSLAVRRQARPR